MGFAGERVATVAVIGAGQAGLSAGYHLQRRGFRSALEPADGGRNFVILDAEQRPGGAWQHRWQSLTMSTVNGIFDLPGYPKPRISPESPSRDAVPAYFSAYEDAMRLPILRPITVARVSDAQGELRLETDAGVWTVHAVINATGTWTNPVWPRVPGAATFAGRQLHTKDYVSLERFAGERVAIVGAGISAVQLLEEISRVASVAWYTRREPRFIGGGFSAEVEGRETIEKVVADVEAGNPSGSIVSYTGLPLNDYVKRARDRGALTARPMFTAIEPHGVREADGSFTSVDAILWATGFRPALAHLDPLRLHNERGGIVVRGTEVVADPRVHLIGFGPSQSTIGANRAGRQAVSLLAKRLDAAAADSR